jgi:hypothetical protein
MSLQLLTITLYQFSNPANDERRGGSGIIDRLKRRPSTPATSSFDPCCSARDAMASGSHPQILSQFNADTAPLGAHSGGLLIASIRA